MSSNSLLLFLGTILILCYLYAKIKYAYWSERGVPCVRPIFPFGNLLGVGYKTNLGERVRDLYFSLKEQTQSGIVGAYFFVEPNALVTDLDLLRNVFVKDFQHFSNRGMYVNEEGDPLSAHLFSLPSNKWKRLRPKLTPTFTSGRMKMMHTTLLIVAKQFSDHLETIAGNEVEIKELLAQFTTDVIGNVAFGLECNSMKDRDNEFRTYGRRFFDFTPLDFLRRMFLITFPKLSLRLNLNMIDPEISRFFMQTIRKTIEFRERNNVQRNDFLQLLIEIKNTGKLGGHDRELGTLSFEELAAQTFIFFTAGFETSSSTMSFATYEMALKQELQDKARQEVQEVLQRHNGVMSYEAIMEMHLLDRIILGEELNECLFRDCLDCYSNCEISETLRKYPIVAVLRRECERAYQVPNSNVVIEKGVVLSIPVLGIHRDPDIYPDPDQFDPDRFTKEAIADRHPYAWIPFGKGPRDCIGMRFGMMQTRVGLATILNSFRLLPSKNTPIPMQIDPSGLVLSPAGGMYLELVKVSN